MKKTLPNENVKIEKLVHGGQGMGVLADGRKVFAWNAMPGEEVVVRLTKSKKDFAEGIVEEILKPHKDRIANYASDIELSTQAWSIMSYGAELAYKAEILCEAFEREGLEVKKPEIQTAGSLSAYRNKVEFSFWGDDDGLYFAHYLRASHQKQKLEYPYNNLIPDQMANYAKGLLDELNKQNVRAGDLKSLILRCDGKSTIDSEVVGALFVKTKRFIKLTQENLVVYYSNPKSPASVATKLLNKVGSTSLVDKILDTDVEYDVLSFFQVNLQVFNLAAGRIDHFLKGLPKIDLYCGVGSIGIPLGQTKTLIDIDAVNIEMAKKNIGALPIEAVCTPSEKAVDYITGEQAVIVDPPRAGLHASVVDKLIEVKPSRIAYLSCNPSTQARDVRHLVAGGYKILALEGYNFFPRTPHIESLVILSYEAA